MFDCDDKHELTRRSAEKKRELQAVNDTINENGHNQSITIDDLQDLVMDYTTLNITKRLRN
jgi:hypothetical protein